MSFFICIVYKQLLYLLSHLILITTCEVGAVLLFSPRKLKLSGDFNKLTTELTVAMGGTLSFGGKTSVFHQKFRNP